MTTIVRYLDLEESAPHLYVFNAFLLEVIVEI